MYIIVVWMLVSLWLCNAFALPKCDVSELTNERRFYDPVSDGFKYCTTSRKDCYRNAELTESCIFCCFQSNVSSSTATIKPSSPIMGSNSGSSVLFPRQVSSSTTTIIKPSSTTMESNSGSSVFPRQGESSNLPSAPSVDSMRIPSKSQTMLNIQATKTQIVASSASSSIALNSANNNLTTKTTINNHLTGTITTAIAVSCSVLFLVALLVLVFCCRQQGWCVFNKRLDQEAQWNSDFAMHELMKSVNENSEEQSEARNA